MEKRPREQCRRKGNAAGRVIGACRRRGAAEGKRGRGVGGDGSAVCGNSRV